MSIAKIAWQILKIAFLALFVYYTAFYMAQGF